MGAWKLHVRLYSQTGNNYGFRASRDSPLLFQVEQDLGERFDRAKEQGDMWSLMMLHQLEGVRENKSVEAGTFWTSDQASK